MTEEIYVWGGLADLLVGYLDENGLDAPALRHELQQYDPARRMPITVWWSLLEHVSQCQPTPALGVFIGQQVKIHQLGVLGYLAASCETLGEVLLRFQRFQPLLHNLTPSLIGQESGAFRFSWDPSYGKSTQLSNEVLVSGLLWMLRTLTADKAPAPSYVAFPGPWPADQTLYETLLGCKVRFEARTLTIHWPLEILSLPINGSDPHLRGLLDQQAQAQLQTLPRPDAFLAELQHQMSIALQEGEPSAEQVARRMALPVRTLYRHLQQRALTYKSLLGGLRFQLARQYLADPRLSLPEIAMMLGYSEQSAFTRAFKSWCGQTPLNYRKAHKTRRGDG
ncbi:MAG: AraC family transcriptional regulator ligand-binding domain-containing protein [Alcanivorax sp.]|nr:AraC family transcriptional regulator ligand-binding domain-containing protein [Alcanivorax sp.]